MRLRLTAITLAILVAVGTFLFAQRRARAEHERLALLQSEAEPAARPAIVGAGGAAGATAAAGPSIVAAPPTAVPAVPPAGAGIAPVAPAPALPSPVAGPNVGFHVAPSAYYAQVHYAGPVPGDDPETNELASEDQQLEQEVQSLARQLADTDDDKQRADLKDKLASALEKQFDTQQKLRQLEISRIEARVQKLRDLVRKRTDSRRKIIENRLEQLLNDADGLGWNSGKGAGPQFVPYGPGVAPRPGTPPRSLPPTPTVPARS